MEIWQWVLVVILAVVVVLFIPYSILKYAYHKPLQNFLLYICNIFMFPMWIFAIYETPRKRREKLKKAGVKEGQVIWTLAVVPVASRFLPRG